jgi:hypothetical protein
VKTFVLLILLLAVVAFYFGYGPYDLVRAFQPARPASIKRVHRAAPEPTSEQPRTKNTSVVVATSPEGSLENRWSPYPSALPTATVKH